MDTMVITEFGKFQLEAVKLKRVVVFQVTVFQKNERRSKKLFAETQCSDPYHFIIEFYIKYADSIPEIIEKFKKQLVHRGFTPIRYRTRDTEKNRWNPWIYIEETDENSLDVLKGNELKEP